MKRIGILGGTFDPVHLGHLMMAQAAIDAFALDQVIFVVAHCSPFKQTEKNTDAAHRLAMVRLALRGNPRLSVSDVELKRGGVSYTVDTLRHFCQRTPKAKLFLIIGDDNADGLQYWKEIDRLQQMVDFIVIERCWFDVSSTLVRQRLQRKKSIRYLTPEAVVSYIKQHGLYAK